MILAKTCSRHDRKILANHHKDLEELLDMPPLFEIAMSIWIGHRYTDAGLQNRLAAFFVKPQWTPLKGVDFGSQLLLGIDDGMRDSHEQAWVLDQQYPASTLIESRALREEFERRLRGQYTDSVVPDPSTEIAQPTQTVEPDLLPLGPAQNQHQLLTMAAMEHSTGLAAIEPGKILAQSSERRSIWSSFRTRTKPVLSTITLFRPGGTPFDATEAEIAPIYRKNKMSQWVDELDEPGLDIVRDSYKDIVRTSQKIKHRSEWKMLPQVEVEDAEARKITGL